MKNKSTKYDRGYKRRIERTDSRILDATYKILENPSLKRITAEGIMKEAGVSKTTFYTRYKNVSELLLNISNNRTGQSFFSTSQNMISDLVEFLKSSIDRNLFIQSLDMRLLLTDIIISKYPKSWSNKIVIYGFIEMLFLHYKNEIKINLEQLIEVTLKLLNDHEIIDD